MSFGRVSYSFANFREVCEFFFAPSIAEGFEYAKSGCAGNLASYNIEADLS